jgi:pimeloyl-ACP methyl ester carboxylesterase
MTHLHVFRPLSNRSVKKDLFPYAKVAVAAAGILAASAIVNQLFARRAEQSNPPQGKFLNIQGVRLHFVERGNGEALILLHGNGSMVQDFETSGLIDMAAKSYRVIAFDRPGYGHSDRPRSVVWTANAQAALISEAMTQLGVSRAIVLGHSWGASVAVALALRHPDAVSALVLASGYFYPSLRSDVVTSSGPAFPIFGDVLRYTISPIVGRIIWPLVLRKLFGPSHAPPKFDGFPVEMTLRPSTIRASAADAALMIPDAFAAQAHYGELKIPVALIAGEADRIVDSGRQSGRLHKEVCQSTYDPVQGAGHMVHQTAPERVMAAIEIVSSKISILAEKQRAAVA